MAKFNPDDWPACWVLKLIAADNVHGFYVSGFWKAKAKAVLKTQRNRCWDCEHKAPAVPTTANTVHHVKPLRQRPDLALSDYDEDGNVQLIALCESCHWNRHHERRAVRIPERW